MEKLPPPLPEILVLGPPQSLDFQSFLAPQSPEFFSWLNIVFIYHPHGFFVNRGGGGYETNINSQVYSFDIILIQKQCDCQHCILYLGYVLSLQYMPEKTPTCTTDSSLLTSLPTAEIVIDKIPHTPEESQLKHNTPFGKKRSPSMGGARIFAGYNGNNIHFLWQGLLTKRIH